MTTPPSGTIYSFRSDRLGGRLNALINSMRLAQVTGAPMRIHWHQDPDVGAPINDPTELFEDTFVARHFIDAATWESVRRGANWLLYLGPVDTEAVSKYLAQGRDLLVNTVIGPLVLADEDEALVRRDIGALWRGFPLARRISECLPLLRDRLGPDAAAYHIRRGDIVTHPREINRPWPDKFIVDEMFRVHIERMIAKGARPILFSDDPSTIERFRAWYPALVPSARLFDGLGPLTQGQIDFLEMIVMALCRSIIAPKASAYSRMAALLDGREATDVTQNLTPAEFTRAKDSLLARLSQPDPATIHARRGEIGQSLWHLDALMRADGKAPDSTRIIAAQVDAGLDVSFVYPLLMRGQLEAGDPAGVLETAANIAGRVPYYGADTARCHSLRAIAYVLLGDTARAASLANLAYWYHVASDPKLVDPGTPEIEEIVALLLESGDLDASNFLPVSPVAARLCRKPATALLRCPAFAGFLARHAPRHGNAPMTVRMLAPMEWDWRMLMRGPITPRFATDPNRQACHEMLLVEAQENPSSDASSLIALHDALMGEHDSAIDRMRALAKGQDNDAIVQHRLSVTAVLAGKHHVARHAADAAVSAALGIAAHLAWRGRLLRNSAPLDALSDLEAALSMGLAIPTIHMFIAEAAGKLGQSTRQEAAIDKALLLAPQWIEALIARARFQVETGQTDAAPETLDRIDGLAPGLTRVKALRTLLSGGGNGVNGKRAMPR